MSTKDREAIELAKLLAEKQRRVQYNRLNNWFPEEGPFRRELYKKHVAFMDAGSRFIQRMFIAANQSGKTQTAGFETALHLTGLYPEWFKGKRFYKPTTGWAASKTTSVTRDSVQRSLLGPPEDIGSGMIPKECIVSLHKKSGSAADSYEKVVVKHISGGLSSIIFKSYDMGRESFQASSLDFIWLDEEPSDAGIYTECLTRTVATEGIVYVTFTPLFGMSEVVLSFLKEGQLPYGGIGESIPGKFVVNVTWDDVPHLSEERKNILLAAFSAHERDARSKGLPSLGSGAIYPFNEKEISVDPFPIPDHWPRWYGMDVGWKVTGCAFFSKNPETGVVYQYDEYYGQQQQPILHAAAIKSRGTYIPGFIDPAANQSEKSSGAALMDIYQNEGLILNNALNAVEPGISLVSQYFATGSLKIFSTCTKTFEEFRLYRRNEDGRIVKALDHLMDALRYGIVSGIDSGISKRDYFRDMEEELEFYGNKRVERDTTTGY